MTYSMKRKCAWCGLNMEDKPCEKDQADLISHGICATYKEKVEKELADYDTWFG